MSNEEILVFEDFDDLMETIMQVNQMTRAQLIAYEEQMNYTSYGRMVDDIYEAIVPQDTFVLDSLLLYVENNSDYIYLEDDGEGDKVLEAKFSANSQYYIMNDNRMYIIGDSVYKLFHRGLLITSIENYLEMVGIGEDDLDFYLEESDYLLLSNYEYGKKKGAKDIPYYAGAFPNPGEAITGNDKTYIRLMVAPQGYNNSTKIYDRTVDCLVRPYRRVLGIWFWCNRSISANFRCRIDYVGTNNQWNNNIIVPPPLILNNRATAVYPYQTIYQNDHFGGLDAWGKTPSTNYARIQINTQICY